MKLPDIEGIVPRAEIVFEICRARIVVGRSGVIVMIADYAVEREVQFREVLAVVVIQRHILMNNVAQHHSIDGASAYCGSIFTYILP